MRFSLPADAGAVAYSVSQVSVLAQAFSSVSAGSGALTISIYTDDGAAQPAPRTRVRLLRAPYAGRPCAQLRAVMQISTLAALSISRNPMKVPYSWSTMQAPTSWPTLSPGSAYWVVLAPGAPLASGDGVLWGAFNRTWGGAPPAVFYDAQFFGARQLRVPGGCRSTSALALSQSTPNWSKQGAYYVNWLAAGSPWRYGLSVIGVPLF